MESVLRSMTHNGFGKKKKKKEATNKKMNTYALND